MNQLISVILPVYNGEKYISDSILSVLNQTFKNFELIIVNDCSTDNTLAIIAEFAKKDPRIKIITNQINKKLPATLNIGHQKAKGDFITWTSDDNLYKPDAFKQYIHHLQNSQSQIVYSDIDLINHNGEFLRMRKLAEPEYLINGNFIGSSFLYKREVFEILEGYNEDLFLVEDYDFWLRAFNRFKFHYIKKSIYSYRLHSESLTSQISLNEEKSNLWKKNLGYMFQVFLDNYTTQSVFFGEVFTKQLTYESILLSDLLEYEKDFEFLIMNLTTKDLFIKKNIKIALKEKFLQLLILNPQKGYVFKFSMFIISKFWRELKFIDIKILIRHTFFK